MNTFLAEINHPGNMNVVSHDFIHAQTLKITIYRIWIKGFFLQTYTRQIVENNVKENFIIVNNFIAWINQPGKMKVVSHYTILFLHKHKRKLYIFEK